MEEADMHYGWIALLVLAMVFMTPLSRVLLAVVFGRAIGKAALARQPDTIRLEPMDSTALRNGRACATWRRIWSAPASRA
jgi:hypothetical protein